MKNRSFPAFLALVFLAACASVTPGPQPPPAPLGHFRVLQVNDVYKIEGLAGGQIGGLSRLRSLRKHLESDGTPLLLLHAGDALYPSVMSKYLEARPMVDVLNLLDGDAGAFDPRLVVTFGNHEFDRSDPAILLDRLRDSQFEWVSTNAVWCHPACDAPFPGVKQTILTDIGGVRVGILGVMYPASKSYFKTTDVHAAAAAAVDALRGAGARVVIAITHEDMGDDVKLLGDLPGIDLVVGGHDHLFMQNRVGTRWVAKADADVKSAIVYDVTVPPSGPIVTTPIRVAVDATIPKDPAVDAAVRGWLAQLGEKLGGNETIATTRFLLEGTEPAVRGRETALGNLLADVARRQMQTDVAVINGGGIRINDDIPPGPITRYEMEGIFYYSNALVAFPATGRQLLDILRNSVSRADFGDGRFLQVSGLRFTYHPPAMTVNASDVEVDGRPLDLDATYSVATVDYLYQHGTEDGYVLFSDATRPPKLHVEREADFRKTVEAWLRAQKVVDTAVEGRIVRAEE